MLLSILLGVAVVAVIVIVGYLVKHHTPAPVVDPKAMVATVAAGLQGQFDKLSEDLSQQFQGVPAMVSSEVARLQEELAAALQRAQTAEAAIEADKQAHAADLAAVASRVAAAVAASPELPPAA